MDDALGLQQRVRVGGTDIYYEVSGSGPPLVLAHGLCGSGRWWSANAPFLARRFQVYSLDLVGFGRSRGGPPFRLGDAASTLAEWMRQCLPAPAHLVGHSMGGHIAAELAADYPELVARLVLVDAAAGRFDVTLAPGALAGLPTLLRTLSPAFIRMLLSDASCAGPATIARALSALLATDLESKLGQITAPTLVIWGSDDMLVPLAVGRRIAAAIPGAQLAVLPRTGHNPMIERPETFNRLVHNFLHNGVVSSEAADAPPYSFAIPSEA
jgi:pimeloyl-ACP methyl ester carboxylesterase